MPGPFGAPHAVPAAGSNLFGGSALQQPFGIPTQPQMPPQTQPVPQGRIQFGQKASQAGSNPFGGSSLESGTIQFGSNAGQANPHSFGQNAVQPTPNPFGQSGVQPGRLQFGSKAGQPAAAQFGPAGNSSFGGQPFGPQSNSSQPFRKPFNSTDDPFGRQKPGQAAYAQQSSNSNPFGDQQQPPATPETFSAFGGPQNGQPSQSGIGKGFQTPAVQQRPAFAGGVAASLQTPVQGETIYSYIILLQLFCTCLHNPYLLYWAQKGQPCVR